MRITYSSHARRRMKERNVTQPDVESVMSRRARTYPSSKKRTETGRTLGGKSLKVVYTEEKRENFHIVTVVIP